MTSNAIKALTGVTIPDDIRFADLGLQRDPVTGDVSFRKEVIERICEASGIDSALILESPEDSLAALIVAWYAAHRERGCDPDPVADDLIGEVVAENALGGGFSHSPGRA